MKGRGSFVLKMVVKSLVVEILAVQLLLVV